MGYLKARDKFTTMFSLRLKKKTPTPPHFSELLVVAPDGNNIQEESTYFSLLYYLILGMCF